MIAGADLNTLSSVESYLSKLGHVSKIARNGLECLTGLRGFVPELLVMEFDIYWSGYDGVMTTLNDDPRLKGIPVVFFTESRKQLPLEAYPCVIAHLKHPIHSHELSRLRAFIDTLESRRAMKTTPPKRNGPMTADFRIPSPLKTDHGNIRRSLFKVPPRFRGL